MNCKWITTSIQIHDLYYSYNAIVQDQGRIDLLKVWRGHACNSRRGRNAKFKSRNDTVGCHLSLIRHDRCQILIASISPSYRMYELHAISPHSAGRCALAKPQYILGNRQSFYVLGADVTISLISLSISL